MNGPLESKGDQRRLASTLHALDHASRLAETAGEEGGFETASVGSSGARSHATALEPELPEPPSAFNTSAAPLALAGAAIVRLEHCAKELDDPQRTHRSATLSAATDGELTASEAMARVDAVRRLAALGHHAWRAAAHLAGWGT
jgi:phosphate:Na+ symporter